MAERIDVGLPEGLDVVRHGSHVEIVLKWFSWKIVALTGCAIFWDGFLVDWYLNVAPGAGRMATYEVRAVTQNGRSTKLVGGLETSELALSIEQEVEKRLGITDVPVAGEMRDYR